jgi:hypothetical protein
MENSKIPHWEKVELGLGAQFSTSSTTRILGSPTALVLIPPIHMGEFLAWSSRPRAFRALVLEVILHQE